MLKSKGNGAAARDNGPITPVTTDAPMNGADTSTMDISGILTINLLGLRGMVRDKKVRHLSDSSIGLIGGEHTASKHTV